MDAVRAIDSGCYVSAAEAVGGKTSFTMAAARRVCTQIIF